MNAAPDQVVGGPVGAGDDDPFEAMIRPLIDPAYRFACVMLRDPEAAQDVVQEAAVKAWRKLDRVRTGAPVRPWFLGIVANQCRSLRRTRWWSVLRVADPVAASDAPDDGVARGLDLRRAIARLNRRQRATVTLHYYLDLPLEEVAAITHQSLPAVRSQLYRALQRMRPILEVPEALL